MNDAGVYASIWVRGETEVTTTSMATVIRTSDLKGMKPEKEFFIGVDSDGCVFDSMELKHKECFCPAFVNHYGLQAVSRYARETWEFVNLYSKTRGVNRFRAVVRAIGLLRHRPEVMESVGPLIATDDLETWIASETRLSGSTLSKYLADYAQALAPDSILFTSLRWSNDVMEAVKKIVHDLPPMLEAVSALEAMSERADCVVVSQTPAADLIREWQENGIDRFPRMIAGQEQGTKTEHLALAAGAKYGPGRVLMIGDAPGDHAAARANGFLFFPIIPGRERQSWRELHDRGLNRFFTGEFAGIYQDERLEEFNQSLPEHPPWTERK